MAGASCGIYLGQFALNSTLWFFLTWFPTYLVKYRGMDFIKSGFLASLPFLAAFVGVLCSGVLSDWLMRRGASQGFARKLPIISGLLISTCIIGANYVTSTGWVIAFMTIAFFGNGFASITWSLVSAPARLLGLTGGVFNLIGNLSAIATPIVIGLLVDGADFSRAITYIAAMALAGSLSYGLLVGRSSASTHKRHAGGTHVPPGLTATADRASCVVRHVRTAEPSRARSCGLPAT